MSVARGCTWQRFLVRGGAKVNPWIVRLVTVVVLLVGMLFLLDALWWYATGDFFVPGWK